MRRARPCMNPVRVWFVRELPGIAQDSSLQRSAAFRAIAGH